MRKDKAVNAVFFVIAHPGCKMHDVLENIWPEYPRGYNSGRRHAYADMRELVKRGAVIQKNGRLYPAVLT